MGSELKNFILGNYETMSASDWMRMSDKIFQMCTEWKEEELFLDAYEAFVELKNRSIRSIDEVRIGHSYCTRFPVFPYEKNINSMIVDMAFPIKAIEMKLMIEYYVMAKSAKKRTSYLERFWYPSKRSEGAKLKMNDGKMVRVPRDTQQLAIMIWPEVNKLEPLFS